MSSDAIRIIEGRMLTDSTIERYGEVEGELHYP